MSYAPQKPVRMVCLGPLDGGGAYLLRSSEVGGPGYVYVAVGCPFYGVLTKPFTIEDVAYKGLGTDVIADILVFFEVPPSVPTRAPLYVTGTLTDVSGTVVASRGRARWRVAINTPTGGATSIGIFVGISSAANAIIPITIYAGGAAVTDPLVYEFNSANGPIGATYGTKGPSAPDQIQISCSTASRTVVYTIEAWDQ